MSNTEPTEEQKQAAREFLCHGPSWPILARFLAEREAKLRDNIIDDDIEYYKACQAAYSTENDTLRARVAELEASLGSRIVSTFSTSEGGEG